MEFETNLFENNIPIEEFICGNNIIKICNELNVPFSKIDFWQKEVAAIRKDTNTVFVTHQGDNPVTQFMVNSIPRNVKVWFALNSIATSTANCKVVGLPLGLNNVDYVESKTSTNKNYSTNFSHIAPFQENILKARKERKNKDFKNLVYSNFSLETNFSQRVTCKTYFSDKNFVTTEEPTKTHFEYLLETLKHPFVLSPPGNGIDCIRIWESMYLGRIPIVLNSSTIRQFDSLPILFVNSWEDVTENLLNDFLEKTENSNLSMLYLSYWKELIQKTKESIL